MAAKRLMVVVVFLFCSEYVSAYPGYPPCPSFMVGYGHGGTDEYVGNFGLRQCVQHCTNLRQKDPNVNGVTMPMQGKGCFCESNMRTIARSSRYKTCYLKDMIKFPLQLKFLDKDGGPSISFPIASCLIVKLKDASNGRGKHKQMKQFWFGLMVPSGGANDVVGVGYTMNMKVPEQKFKDGLLVEVLFKMKCPVSWWSGKPEKNDYMGTGVVSKGPGGDILAMLQLEKL